MKEGRVEIDREDGRVLIVLFEDEDPYIQRTIILSVLIF